jgi:spore maturation protein CgeB
MKIVILGLSITSSWGNGHATTYRGLVRELSRRGHDVLFLERDVPWYAGNRDLPEPPYARVGLYSSLADLQARFRGELREADLAVVGSFVPEGVAVGEWVIENVRGIPAFYDIDTPVTMARLQRGDGEYLAPRLIPHYRLYLSFTGGPLLAEIERRYGSPMARALYCSVDPELYFPDPASKRWDLGYIGTYSEDRQPFLDCLLLEPARRWPAGRFMIAGPLYPEGIAWPANVGRLEHLPPSGHRAFYNAQRFTLNLTRAAMKAAGFSPSVRLFEAAACGAAIVSDSWRGLETIFETGREILVAAAPDEMLHILRETPDADAAAIGARARARILAEHTAAHRAAELERHYREAVAQAFLPVWGSNRPE